MSADPDALAREIVADIGLLELGERGADFISTVSADGVIAAALRAYGRSQRRAGAVEMRDAVLLALQTYKFEAKRSGLHGRAAIYDGCLTMLAALPLPTEEDSRGEDG